MQLISSLLSLLAVFSFGNLAAGSLCCRRKRFLQPPTLPPDNSPAKTAGFNRRLRALPLKEFVDRAFPEEKELDSFFSKRLYAAGLLGEYEGGYLRTLLPHVYLSREGFKSKYSGVKFRSWGIRLNRAWEALGESGIRTAAQARADKGASSGGANLVIRFLAPLREEGPTVRGHWGNSHAGKSEENQGKGLARARKFSWDS